MEVRRCEGETREKTEQRNPQEILAVPVDNSPGWPIPVLSISLSVHLPIIPSEDGAKTRVEMHFSPSGPGCFAHPQEASHSTPQLSISAYFPHRTSVFKKKFKKKKKERKATTTSGLQIQQAIHGEHWWEGASSLTGQSATSLLFTLLTSLVHCTIRTRRPFPETISTPACPQPGVGRGQVRKGRKRQRLMRVSVGETEAEASREI